MEESALKNLLERLLHKELLTPEEVRQLQQYVRDENNTPQLDSLLEAAYTNKAFAETRGYDRDVVFPELMKKIKKPGPLYRKMLVRYVAVAAVLVAVTGIYLVWRYAENRHPAVPKQQARVITPGGYHAVLTLADGSEIQLDTASTGWTKQQDGVQIRKKDSGQLVYTPVIPGSNPGSTVFYNTLTTPRGGQYQLLLPDGTKVWLNAASTLKYPTTFNGKERCVELTGEGYFEVASGTGGKSAPFCVKTGTATIAVLGTHFNIMAYADEATLNTTLLKGKVKVISSQGSSLLRPGEQARLQQNGSLTVVPADIEEVTAWKNGLFVFRGADIRMVMRQLSRWYDIEVVYEGPAKQHRFSGEFYRSYSWQQMLSILRGSAIRFRVEGRKLIITQ
jgi:ferric-dicitrate binding protein FerR (iron transport regulator)